MDSWRVSVSEESDKRMRRARGFAAMDQHKQREIASKGGRAAHQKGSAHEFDAEQARQAGHKGGVTVSRNRDYMVAFGRNDREPLTSPTRRLAAISRTGGATGS